MQQITLKQFNSLVDSIYSSFMAMPEMGMGEMGEARREAEEIAMKWCYDNNIKITD